MGKQRWGWVPGAAVGLLLGISAGLSSVPVIATIIAALTAGLLVLLGVKDAQAPADSYQVSGADMRIGGFALACSIALVAGVAIRANDWLAPSPSKMQQKWTNAGFSDARAQAITLYQKTGLLFSQPEAGSDKQDKQTETTSLMETKDSKVAGASSSLLFADNQTACPFLDRSQYNSTDAMLHSMSLQDAKLKSLAQRVSALPPADRDSVLQAVYGFVCGG